MLIRLRLPVSLGLVSLAAIIALGATPAIALQAIGPVPELVCGVVTALDSRVVHGSGVILTDVQVVESQPGGRTVLTTFTMRGGEVGELGMWSEQFTHLHVGDSVTAGVATTHGVAVAVMAPRTGTAISHDDGMGLDSRVDRVAAGYIWSGIHWPDDESAGSLLHQRFGSSGGCRYRDLSCCADLGGRPGFLHGLHVLGDYGCDIRHP